MTVRIECCWAMSKKYPSGWALTHARNCPVAPGEKVRRDDRPIGTPRLRLVVGGSAPTRVSRRARPRLSATQTHPACQAAVADGATPCSRCAPLLHPAACVCGPCQAFDAAMDGASDAITPPEEDDL